MNFNNDFNNCNYEDDDDYNITFLRCSCHNCWILYEIHKVAGVYKVKNNTLSLCDVCYFKIRDEHKKRGTEFKGVQIWERIRENPNFR